MRRARHGWTHTLTVALRAVEASPRGGSMQNLATKVEKVTVHRNGALVVRRGVAVGARGRVLGLPLLFSSESLRVRTAVGTVLDLRETAELVSDAVTTPAPSDELQRQARVVEALMQKEQGVQA